MTTTTKTPRLTLDAYFGKWGQHKDVTASVRAEAEKLVAAVNAALDAAEAEGVPIQINPKTGTVVSGKEYGGFRPQSCPQGASRSAHKVGQAVDLYDPIGLLDKCFNSNRQLLEKHGLYMEEPGYTHGWCHLQTRKASRTVFLP